MAKEIEVVAEDVKYVIVGKDSYMLMMVDLTDNVELALLTDKNCIEVPFSSHTITKLCDLVREHDVAVLDFVRG